MGTLQHKKFKRWCLTPGFPEGLGHHKTGYLGDFLLGGFDEAEHSVEPETTAVMEFP